MGESRRGSPPGGERSNNEGWGKRDAGPRNPDGTWVAGVVRGNYKPFPFPVGYRQGALVVTGWLQHSKPTGRSAGWHPMVRCDCGWEGKVDRYNFKAGRTTRCNSCGKIAGRKKRYWRYEHVLPDEGHRTRLLNRISSCISRCHNSNTATFPSYGGRGITVHEPWRKDRTAFLRYLLSLEGWDNPNFELDRIDNDRGYCPGNLRFVSRKGNLANRRTVSSMQEQIDDLRHRLRRAEEQIHNCDKCRANYCP